MARKPETDKYNYVLDWVKESVDAREAQIKLVERAVKAYKGLPSVNYYKQQIERTANAIARIDSARSAELKAAAAEIPDEKNMTVQEAVETVVSMAQGGVGRYEFAPYDPQMDKDDEIVDRLSSAAKFFYNNERVDSLMPQIIRNAALAGEATLILNPDGDQRKVTLLDNDQILDDPRRVKLNRDRFMGFTQRESWAKVKGSIDKNKGGWFLRSLNQVDTYLSQIRMEINGIDGQSIYGNDAVLGKMLAADLDTFYKPLVDKFAALRGQNSDDPDKSYDGDEIEHAYVYDLDHDMYFEIINRRYIIVGRANDMKRSIKFSVYDDNNKEKQMTKTIKLDHPFVQLGFKRTMWDKYPVTPLFDVLDDFDKLCSMESVLAHNLSIMSALTFIGQSSDAEKVARSAQIAGEIIEGLPQTFGVMKKDHDVNPTIAAIQRKEERIKRALAATDQFQMQAILGDRASAKEVSAMSGQVSQGLNPLLANLETMMSDLGDKFIKMQLIYNKGDYDFTHNGKYAMLSEEDMAGNWEIRAKLVSAIKLEQASNSQHAIQLIQYMGQQTEVVDQINFYGTLVPIVMQGIVTREQAAKMILPKYRPMDEEVIASIKTKAEADAKRNPVDKLDLSQYSGPELDDMIKQLSVTSADPNAYMDGSTEPYTPAPSTAPDGSPINPDTSGVQAPLDSNVMVNGSPVQPDNSGAPAAAPATTPPPTSGDPSTAGEQANDPNMAAA